MRAYLHRLPKKWIAYSWRWPGRGDHRRRTVFGTVMDINEMTRLMQIVDDLFGTIKPGISSEVAGTEIWIAIQNMERARTGKKLKRWFKTGPIKEVRNPDVPDRMTLEKQ